LQYHGGGAPRISAVILLIAEDISSIAKQNPEKKTDYFIHWIPKHAPYQYILETTIGFGSTCRRLILPCSSITGLPAIESLPEPCAT